jgi:hypothetical protein
MEESTRRAVLAEMRQAHEIAAVAVRRAHAILSDLVRWKREGRIFSVEYGGTEYFPLFGLDPITGYQPYPALAEALRILNVPDWGSDWAVATWFVGLSSFLDDQRPQDLLASDAGWVIEAAKDAVYSLSQRNW